MVSGEPCTLNRKPYTVNLIPFSYLYLATYTVFSLSCQSCYQKKSPDVNFWSPGPCFV